MLDSISKNIFVNTDSYKASHFLQYPPNTEYISSYIESRGGSWNKTLFFGLQMFLKEYLCKPVTKDKIIFADYFWKSHGEPFNIDSALRLLDKYDGKLPLHIQAIPEGTVLDTGNVLVQIENTDPDAFWLTSFIETAILRAIWFPTTVATKSFICKKIILNYLKATSDENPDNSILFKLHDFGFRGVSSLESAAIGGCAHLINFLGTDTTAGIFAAKTYYNSDKTAGFSIPAAEHSTITSWGKENEFFAYKNMIDKFASPGSILAVVSDSYDLYNAIEKHWVKLKDQIINSGATVVIRPDSGNPVQVVSETIERLMSNFGYTINNKGYSVLPSYIRVIQGDGINEQSISDILFEMQSRGLSADNIAFGMGGELLQHMNRDTLRFAMKCNSIVINGKRQDVYKDPKTDPMKRSKAGRLALVYREPVDRPAYFQTIREDQLKPTDVNILQSVYKNGELLIDENFQTIRDRTQSFLKPTICNYNEKF